MKTSTMKMVTKAHSILSEGIPVPAKILAAKCGLKAASAYRMVRIMREEGIGIIPTKAGYLLAEHATKRDDVFFLRKLNGRRTSDYIALNGCIDEMSKRWKGVEQTQLRQILAPFNVTRQALTTSLAIINQKSERLGI